MKLPGSLGIERHDSEYFVQVINTTTRIMKKISEKRMRELKALDNKGHEGDDDEARGIEDVNHDDE